MRSRPEPLPQFFPNNLTISDPIFRLKDMFDDGYCSIAIFLDSSMCPQPATPSCDLATIATTLAQMSFLIDKEAQQCIEPPLNSTNSAEDMFGQTLTTNLERLYGRLCTESNDFLPNTSLQDMLSSTGMSSMFPIVMDRLDLPLNEGVKQVKLPTFKEYLQHMAHLQQVVAMAQQLQDDINTTNHKYMAHQIALLYQALSAPALKPLTFKKRIEPQFDDIKKTTEQATVPQLTGPQRVWLQELTGDVLDTLLDLAGPPSAAVHPVLSALAS